MTQPAFDGSLKELEYLMKSISPARYARSRNYLDGWVTYLSPYLSRGITQAANVYAYILDRYHYADCEKLIQELTWREYWQKVWQAKGDAIFTDLKQPQPDAIHQKMIASVAEAKTGIAVIDSQILHLKETGYLHNHLRMYLAAICCNMGKAHWKVPSKWMYYHLLDGDLASNSLSWQWVAGSFSSKKYYCNQDNINAYTKTNQSKTFLDHSYEQLPFLDTPNVLRETTDFFSVTPLPDETAMPEEATRIFLYNNYNLDAEWHAGESGLRILLLEPDHFNAHPIGKKAMSFILNAAGNIPNLYIYPKNFEQLKNRYPEAEIIYKTHPAFTHYRGKAENVEEIFPEVKGYYPSFTAFWKKCLPYIPKK